jgi:hypothetical protein
MSRAARPPAAIERAEIEDVESRDLDRVFDIMPGPMRRHE